MPSVKNNTGKATPDIAKSNVKVHTELDGVSETAKSVYSIILNNSSTVDDIVIKTKLPAAKVMQALTELELNDAVERKSGGVYALPG